MNDWLRPDVLIEILALAATGIAVYTAIRSDLAVLHERTNINKEQIVEVKGEVKTFHQRIDEWYRREPRE